MNLDTVYPQNVTLRDGRQLSRVKLPIPVQPGAAGAAWRHGRKGILVMGSCCFKSGAVQMTVSASYVKENPTSQDADALSETLFPNDAAVNAYFCQRPGRQILYLTSLVPIVLFGASNLD